MKTRRVGTLTLGITLIVMGIAFLVQMLLPFITTSIIFRAWPLIFIFLGVEILFSNWKYADREFIYDKVGIFLTMILIFFAMFLAFFSYMIQYYGEI